MMVIDLSLPLAVVLWSIVGLLAVSAAAVIGAVVAPRWRGGTLRNASSSTAARIKGATGAPLRRASWSTAGNRRYDLPSMTDL